MALLNGVSGLSSQLGSISSLFTPPKLVDPGMTQSVIGSDLGTSFMPQKQINFGGGMPSDSFGGMPSKQLPGDLSSPFQQNAPIQQGSQFAQNAPIGSIGGGAAVLDQYDSAFQQAASQWGIDANWLKAVAATERGWEGTSVAGAQGLMQIMPGGYPSLEAMYPNWQNDPVQNIMLGAAILNAKRMENGGSLERGTMGYLGFGGEDAYGTDANEYLASVKNYYTQLGQGGGFGSGADAVVSTIFGQGARVEDWGEFGVESSNGMYGYGTRYGLNGTQHTAVDVPLAVGSAYRAPMGGVVTCGGTGNGSGSDGSGCSAFNDDFGNGAGRVEVQLDNGTVLIFGHSSTSALQPGQRFNAGDVLGTSGGMVSPHIHLEARVRDSSTPSGWRIVDPRTVLGGMTGGGYGGYGGGGGSYNNGQSIAQSIRAFLVGRR